MDGFLTDDIERYVEANVTPESETFRALAEETRTGTNQPQMQVGPVEGTFLRHLVRAMNARLVVEIGTFTGYSALMMAEGLPEGGRLITCDIDKTATTIARKYWAQSPHGAKIDLRLGRAMTTIDGIDGPIDLVFIDADKQSYIDYWEALVPKVRPGGLLLADNVLWSGRVLDPVDPDDHALAAFNRHVLSDARVETVMLPVRDGITMACKR